MWPPVKKPQSPNPKEQKDETLETLKTLFEFLVLVDLLRALFLLSGVCRALFVFLRMT